MKSKKLRGRKSCRIFSQPRLYAAGKGPEVGDSLELVVGQFDVEVMLKPGKQIHRLQAIDPESFDKVVVGGQLFARNLELGRGKVKYLVERLLRFWHACTHSIRKAATANRAARLCFPQTSSIRLRPQAACTSHKKYR